MRRRVNISSSPTTNGQSKMDQCYFQAVHFIQSYRKYLPMRISSSMFLHSRAAETQATIIQFVSLSFLSMNWRFESKYNSNAERA